MRDSTPTHPTQTLECHVATHTSIRCCVACPSSYTSPKPKSTLVAYGECVKGTRPRRARSTHTRPHLTPRTPSYPFHVLAHIALPTRMEPTAPHAETPVAHNPQHSALHTPATPLEKGKSRMVLDSPASVTTMAADLVNSSASIISDGSFWMVTAFRGPAMEFWVFECAGQPRNRRSCWSWCASSWIS